MKRFMILHIGFEKPTDEIMAQWHKWFEETASCTRDMGGFMSGREISKEGVKDLAWDENCMTGYSVIEADSLDAAEKIAASNPFITAVRVYELRAG